jgi:uncharacterized protein YdaU (DUF1376 family)
VNDSNNRSPAFQFYPKDFLSDEKQISMSLAAVGIYMRLICHCWNEGSLPADPAVLARLSGATKRQIAELWPSISPCFKTSEDGRLVHPRLEREREKQATFRQRQSDRATARWDMDRKLKDARESDATAMPRHKLGIIPALPDEKLAYAKPPQCSSSSSSSASVEQRQIPPPANMSVSQDIQERAGRFLEKYPAIYAEERRGAHFPLKPVLHFQTACLIVQGWPDVDRLELMFRTFCKLPASEKMAWPGTPAQFLHLAPSIDAKLRQAGV